MIDAEGKIRPTPLATGNKLIIAAEDPLLKMEIEQVEGELELIDGRYLNRHGWFFLQSRIPVGKTAGALEWIIKLNSIQGWERDPMIACSQVGYHPEQIKRAGRSTMGVRVINLKEGETVASVARTSAKDLKSLEE